MESTQRPKRTQKDNMTVSVPKALKERLQNEAKAADRSLSWWVANMLSKFVSRNCNTVEKK
jgi:predicted HicB family RNase H-like nuclease